MGKLKLFFTCLLMASISFVNAQTKTASGTVISAEDGLPVIGASVVVKGQTFIGIITDVDGSYSLSVPASAETLVISLVGMKAVEVPALPNQQVTMESDMSELDEVVVVGYTTVKKSSLTGSVGAVANKELKDVPVANAGQALQGKSTGMQVVASTGRPGAAANVKVRGIGSINAGSNPLFVIDGVPLSASDFAALNANDIENVSVLKDASATAIYGSRGANGVVIVTTRRGDIGKNDITAKVQWGFTNKTTNKFTMMNAVEKLTYEKQLGVGLGVTLTDKEIAEYETDTDWEDEILRTGLTQIYDISVKGGTGGTRYLVSGQYYDQKAIVYGSNYRKFSGRLNLEQEILKNLKFDIRIGTGNTQETILRTDRNALNPFNYMYDANPYVAPFDKDGEYTISPYLPYQLNIFEQIDNNPDKSNLTRTIGSASLEWEIIKGLKFKTTEGMNNFTGYWYYYVKPESGLSQLLGEPYGYRTDLFSSARTLLSTNQFTYENVFADMHDVKVIAATEVSRYDYRIFEAVGSGFATGKIDAIGTASVAEKPSGGEEAWRMLSYFGMANYNYDQKYYLDLSLRRDGSSRFGTNHKYGTFWSVGAAWNVKNEVFLNDIWFIDNLKLRASTGIAGNNNIGNYAAQGVFGYGSYNNEITSYPRRLPNPDLTWEKNSQTSVGIDFTALKQRVNLTVDYYVVAP